ncbi:unnamed protein product [Adineta steineri]|uniref:G-protein coupled receptors family 1 profile domain-containing protein n=1 Tax=Adineta steineri TaxID=433720 RepID=A0A814X2I6_9BILA|nr:unnamed protein product [Adineta steineri]CAF1210452.1 unnamed protein product [Adineta steineri]CAF1258178.1 unnamed protein product [Adineta steineri]CAF3507408.1 unnamed protein product [Adineta steineri]CAF3572071.1 unnamed protein product [Adineta steineri]
MNSTNFTSISNSSIINIESWFIPFDILNIICLIIAIILTIIFLIIIIFDKTCHTVPMMLVANSCFVILMCASDILWISIFTLQRDLQLNQYQDIFCIFRGYLTYVLCAALNYSFLLQAFYRYLIVVYPARLFWQLRRNQFIFIIIKWIYVFIFPLPFTFTGDIIYNVNNQICQIPFRLSFTMIFVAICVYGIPVPLIILIYLKLIQYVRKMNKRVIPVNILFRAQRELKMVRRTMILTMIIVILGLPYASFIVVSFFTSPPLYHFRIAYIFVTISLVFVMIVLLEFTEPLKASITKKLHRQSNIIVPNGTQMNRTMNF